jgi:hypothetical protein
VKFEIEKGIEIPKERGNKINMYPFAEMEVGDSFLTEVTHVTGSVANFHKQNPEKKFTTRKVEGGIRVWRIQ